MFSVLTRDASCVAARVIACSGSLVIMLGARRDRGRPGCRRFPAVCIIPFRRSRSPARPSRSKARSSKRSRGRTARYSIANVPAGSSPSAGDRQGLRARAGGADRRAGRRDARRRGRSRAALQRGRVGQPRCAEPVRVLSADDACSPDRIWPSSSRRRSARRLRRSPGVAERSFGPGPSRPVIRGLDGDRVLILEDGQRVGDLSSQSGDHGVTVNPAGVVEDRGRPRTGDAALRLERHRRSRQRDLRHDPDRRRSPARTAARRSTSAPRPRRAGGAADVLVRQQPMGVARLRQRPPIGRRRHAGGHDRQHAVARRLRRRSASRGPASTATSAAATATTTRTTASRSSRKGNIQLTPRRHMFGAARRGGQSGRRVRVVPRCCSGTGATSTTSSRATKSARISRTTRPISTSRRSTGSRAGSSGTIGGSFLTRAFSATGEEALSPPVDENATALFAYEELTWPHVTRAVRRPRQLGIVQHPRAACPTATSPTARHRSAFSSGLRRPTTS